MVAVDQSEPSASESDASRNLASIALYALAIGLASGSNFVTAPLLINLFGEEEFAYWALLEPILLVVVPISGLGINFGLLHLMATGNEPQRAIGKVFAFHVLSVGVTALLCAAVLAAFWDVTIAALMGGLVFAEGLILLLVSYWRSFDQPVRYAAAEGGRAVLIVGILMLALFAGIGAINSAEDYLAARLAVGLVAVVLGIAIVRPVGRPNWATSVDVVKYGLPVVVASTLIGLITTVDRYVVSSVGSLIEVAGYVAHIKLVQILNSALAPFFIWFAPIAIRRLPEGRDAHDFLANSVFMFAVVNLLLSMGLWFVAPVFWPILFGEIVFDPTLFFVLLVGSALFNLGNPVSVSTLREGKTWHALVVTLIDLFVTALAFLILAQFFGVMGVAVARLTGFAVYTLAFAILTTHSLGLRYPWLRMGGLGVAVAAYALFAEISFELEAFWVSAGLAFFGSLILAALAILFRPKTLLLPARFLQKKIPSSGSIDANGNG